MTPALFPNRPRLLQFDFNKKVTSKDVLYHGTPLINKNEILANGLRPSRTGLCFAETLDGAKMWGYHHIITDEEVYNVQPSGLAVFAVDTSDIPGLSGGGGACIGTYSSVPADKVRLVFEDPDTDIHSITRKWAYLDKTLPDIV